MTEVGRISEMEDPVLRNHQITQSYHEISLAFSQRTGPCANWCTFATWASRQAGQSIRKEDLRKALEHLMEDDPALSMAAKDLLKEIVARGTTIDKKGIIKHLLKAVNPEAILDRSSASVARGNRKVYAEIAKEFARFLETCAADTSFNPENLARFTDALKPGDPPEGQRYLKQAFERYYRAIFEPDKKKKAELILLANIEVGFHEQTRLQPEIAEALESAVVAPDRFKANLLQSIFPGQIWMASVGDLFRTLFRRPTPLDLAFARLVPILRQRIRLFLTANMMELGFPKGMVLRLGRDLKSGYPPDLEKLSNAELLDLLKKVDPTPDNLLETGTVDWAALNDRLHFIADLFRCYQESADLLSPPFVVPGQENPEN